MYVYRSWGALLSVYIAGAASPAMAASLEDVNTKLAGYGLPPILFTPPGFTNCQRPLYIIIYYFFVVDLLANIMMSYPNLTNIWYSGVGVRSR